MAVGAVAGVIGRLVSGHGIEIVALLVATVGLLGGGIVVALSYREEAGLSSGTSRFGLAASSVRRRVAEPTTPSLDEELDEMALVHYADELSRVVAECMALCDRVAPAEEIHEARERLATLVASPRYGRAIARGLLDEPTVRAAAERLGREG